jgi:membrane fusion protein (multidrug efflux system)
VNLLALNKSKGNELVIPYKAVIEQLGEYTVYTVGDSSKAQQVIVKLGVQFDQSVVVSSGLKKGDVIIVDGVQNVRPGSVVTTEQPGQANGQPATKK